MDKLLVAKRPTDKFHGNNGVVTNIWVIKDFEKEEIPRTR